MRLMRYLILSCVALIAVAGIVHAQEEEPLSAERPGFTSGTETVALGHIQFETGYTYTHDDGTHEHALGDGGLLRFPLRSNFEARIGLPAYSWERGDMHSEGLGDSSVSLKYRFLDSSPKRHALPSLAVIAGLELPTGKHDFREDDYQPSVALEANWDLTNVFSVNANTVYNAIRQSGTRYDEWAGAVSLNATLSPQWGTYAEIYRVSDTGQGDTHTNFFDTGLTYLVGQNTQLDVNGGCGILGTRHDWFISGGIARRW